MLCKNFQCAERIGGSGQGEDLGDVGREIQAPTTRIAVDRECGDAGLIEAGYPLGDGPVVPPIPPAPWKRMTAGSFTPSFGNRNCPAIDVGIPFFPVRKSAGDMFAVGMTWYSSLAI